MENILMSLEEKVLKPLLVVGVIHSNQSSDISGLDSGRRRRITVEVSDRRVTDGRRSFQKALCCLWFLLRLWTKEPPLVCAPAMHKQEAVGRVQ